MRIGIAGPISQHVLKQRLPDAHDLHSDGYSFPFTAHLALALLDRGHEVQVFALDPACTGPRKYASDGLTLHVAPYRRVGRDRGRDFFKAERRALAEAMGGAKCDVIHAHWTYEFALAALSVQREVVVTVHDWAPTIFRHFRDRYRAMRLLMQAAVLSRARVMTAPSPYIARRVERVSRRPVTVVPNGLPDFFYCPRPAPSSEDVPVIGAINNGISRSKNVQVLLDAFQSIVSSFPTAQLHLAGSGFEPDGPAARLALEVGLTQGVVFHGPLPQAGVAAFLQRCSLFVHPSLEESFGMVVLEAMAAGVPVVVGQRSGALPWVVGSGDAGALVDVTRAEAISTAIEELLSDQLRWADASKCAFDNARARFRIGGVADAYEAVYHATQAKR